MVEETLDPIAESVVRIQKILGMRTGKARKRLRKDALFGIVVLELANSLRVFCLPTSTSSRNGVDVSLIYSFRTQTRCSPHFLSYPLRFPSTRLDLAVAPPDDGRR